MLPMFYRLISLYLILIGGSLQAPSRRPLVRPFKSPLSEDYYDDFIALNEDQQVDIVSDFTSKVPTCQQKCTEPLRRTMKAAIDAPNHYERFNKVCNNFNKTAICMEKTAKNCKNQEPFDIATSGLYYMCIEQRKAFDDVIECIDAQSNEVQKECDEVCFTKSKFAAWAVNSGIFDRLLSLSAGEMENRFQKKSNPKFLQDVARDGCELMRCHLTCIRSKYNARCLNHAGTLLSEAFVRPLAESQKHMGFGPISYVLHAILPRQCDFMINSDVLNQFRIDPLLDKSLKSQYAAAENAENLAEKNHSDTPNKVVNNESHNVENVPQQNDINTNKFTAIEGQSPENPQEDNNENIESKEVHDETGETKNFEGNFLNKNNDHMSFENYQAEQTNNEEKSQFKDSIAMEDRDKQNVDFDRSEGLTQNNQFFSEFKNNLGSLHFEKEPQFKDPIIMRYRFDRLANFDRRENLTQNNQFASSFNSDAERHLDSFDSTKEKSQFSKVMKVPFETTSSFKLKSHEKVGISSQKEYVEIRENPKLQKRDSRKLGSQKTTEISVVQQNEKNSENIHKQVVEEETTHDQGPLVHNDKLEGDSDNLEDISNSLQQKQQQNPNEEIKFKEKFNQEKNDNNEIIENNQNHEKDKSLVHENSRIEAPNTNDQSEEVLKLQEIQQNEENSENIHKQVVEEETTHDQGPLVHNDKLEGDSDKLEGDSKEQENPSLQQKQHQNPNDEIKFKEEFNQERILEDKHKDFNEKIPKNDEHEIIENNQNYGKDKSLVHENTKIDAPNTNDQSVEVLELQEIQQNEENSENIHKQVIAQETTHAQGPLVHNDKLEDDFDSTNTKKHENPSQQQNPNEEIKFKEEFNQEIISEDKHKEFNEKIPKTDENEIIENGQNREKDKSLVHENTKIDAPNTNDQSVEVPRLQENQQNKENSENIHKQVIVQEATHNQGLPLHNDKLEGDSDNLEDISKEQENPSLQQKQHQNPNEEIKFKEEFNQERILEDKHKDFNEKIPKNDEHEIIENNQNYGKDKSLVHENTKIDAPNTNDQSVEVLELQENKIEIISAEFSEANHHKKFYSNKKQPQEAYNEEIFNKYSRFNYQKEIAFENDKLSQLNPLEDFKQPIYEENIHNKRIPNDFYETKHYLDEFEAFQDPHYSEFNPQNHNSIPNNAIPMDNNPEYAQIVEDRENYEEQVRDEQIYYVVDAANPHSDIHVKHL